MWGRAGVNNSPQGRGWVYIFKSIQNKFKTHNIRAPAGFEELGSGVAIYYAKVILEVSNFWSQMTWH